MGDFVHRDNFPLTSVDSICTRCFQTVATRKSEAELEEDERRHACDPAQLARLSYIMPKSA